MQTSTHVASSLSNFGCVCRGPLETKPEDGRREFFSPVEEKGAVDRQEERHVRLLLEHSELAHFTAFSGSPDALLSCN